MDKRAIRVLVTDDHAIVRKGIKALLATEKDIEVVGEAGNGLEAFEKVKTMQPDVVLMDLMMPVMDGIEASRQITTHFPQVHVLVLTSFAADDKVFPAIKAGALGYLLKDSGPDELVSSIRSVHQGLPSLEPTIARKVLLELSQPPKADSPVDPLSERELEVLRLIAQGLSNKEIADQLVVTEFTVRSHVSKILSKLHLVSRTQAALFALKKGLASIDDVPDVSEP
jgi:two-component system, NarL family, response regulator LiaR